MYFLLYCKFHDVIFYLKEEVVVHMRGWQVTEILMGINKGDGLKNNVM